MAVIVCGIGRSGTSTVARVLHEHGVCMGERFRPADAHNDKGYFEDLDFRDINEAVLTGKITFPEFYHRLRALVRTRSGNWGIKDPRICTLSGFYLPYIPGSVLVHCKRNHDDVIDSLMRCYGWAEPVARRLVGERSEALSPLLKLCGAITIDIDTRPSDADILLQLIDGGIQCQS